MEHIGSIRHMNFDENDKEKIMDMFEAHTHARKHVKWMGQKGQMVRS